MDILDKSPGLRNLLEKLLKTRRNEILNSMLKTDGNYKKLIDARTKASVALKDILETPETNVLFEAYSDAIYAQEIYELDAVYEQGFIDAVTALRSQDAL